MSVGVKLWDGILKASRGVVQLLYASQDLDASSVAVQDVASLQEDIAELKEKVRHLRQEHQRIKSEVGSQILRRLDHSLH